MHGGWTFDSNVVGWKWCNGQTAPLGEQRWALARSCCVLLFWAVLSICSRAESHLLLFAVFSKRYTIRSHSRLTGGLQESHHHCPSKRSRANSTLISDLTLVQYCCCDCYNCRIAWSRCWDHRRLWLTCTRPVARLSSLCTIVEKS